MTNLRGSVMGAVMFGRQHDQPGILIEPIEEYPVDINDQQQVSEFRNKILSVPVIFGSVPNILITFASVLQANSGQGKQSGTCFQSNIQRNDPYRFEGQTAPANEQRYSYEENGVEII